MKTTTAITSLAALVLVFSGCRDKQFEERTYIANVPVYMDEAEFMTTVKSSDARDITEKGKIFLKDNFILINEPNEGIHVIDNTNPSSPTNTCFLAIPGNVDMAAIGDVLYADSYQDLLVIDISDFTAISVLERFEDIYPGAFPPLADNRYPIAQIDEEKGIVVGWEVEEITEKIENGAGGRVFVPFRGAVMEDAAALSSANIDSRASSSPGSVSIAGSMARMALAGNYLYTVGNGNLAPFNIANRTSPTRGQDISVASNIETLFPFGENLLVGTTTGMLIYGLVNPEAPNYISTFWHATSCDPVVAEGNTAYVTLRGGRPCGGFTNQLDIIDITDITNPTLIKSYEMDGPYGLGIDDGTLFLCDGDAGLKVYDVTDPLTVDQNLLAQHSGINTYDVIPYSDRLIMIGDDGLFQYDYSSVANLQLLSVINAK